MSALSPHNAGWQQGAPLAQPAPASICWHQWTGAQKWAAVDPTSAAPAGLAVGASAPASPQQLLRPADTSPVVTTNALLKKPEGVGAGCECTAAACSISVTVFASLTASSWAAC